MGRFAGNARAGGWEPRQPRPGGRCGTDQLATGGRSGSGDRARRTETFDADLVTPTTLAAIVETTIERFAGTQTSVPERTILRPERLSVRSGTAASRRRPLANKAGRGQLPLF
jgi:hypothetical protein